MVQCYAALNRVTSEGLSMHRPAPEAVLEVPITAFLPSEADVKAAKEDVKVKKTLKSSLFHILSIIIF